VSLESNPSRRPFGNPSQRLLSVCVIVTNRWCGFHFVATSSYSADAPESSDLHESRSKGDLIVREVLRLLSEGKAAGCPFVPRSVPLQPGLYNGCVVLATSKCFWGMGARLCGALLRWQTAAAQPARAVVGACSKDADICV